MVFCKSLEKVKFNSGINYICAKDIFVRIHVFFNVFQLQEKLSKEDKEHRKLKLKLELQEKATEAQIAEKTAGIAYEYEHMALKIIHKVVI